LTRNIHRTAFFSQKTLAFSNGSDYQPPIAAASGTKASTRSSAG
jgi:hypothetical protein